jgi:hypothetical protein
MRGGHLAAVLQNGMEADFDDLGLVRWVADGCIEAMKSMGRLNQRCQ